jgi:hypothetical protein
MSLAMIEAMPYSPGGRYSRSDYHRLREISDRPFLFLTAGRSSHYHTPDDTADRLDYGRMAHSLRFLARLTVRAAEGEGPLLWKPDQVDALSDARILLRFLDTVDTDEIPASVAKRMASDRAFTEALIARAEEGGSVSPSEYRRLQLASMRYQAVVWSPDKWWWSLW